MIRYVTHLSMETAHQLYPCSKYRLLVTSDRTHTALYLQGTTHVGRYRLRHLLLTRGIGGGATSLKMITRLGRNHLSLMSFLVAAVVKLLVLVLLSFGTDL
jgi:hypothetical protein